MRPTRRPWLGFAFLATLSLIALAPRIAHAGEFDLEETALRERFEGSYVTVKLDMPGTSDGVDVRPSRKPDIDIRKLGARIKNCGVAIRRGDEVMVTKVKVTRNLIEFQLAGGGYGTFSDILANSDTQPEYLGESRLERDLKRQLDATSDPAERARIQLRIDKAKEDRKAANAANQSASLSAKQQGKANEKEMRKSGGSRFNIRGDGALPAEARTVDGLMAILANHVDFGSESGAPAMGAGASEAAVPADAERGSLSKGMTREQVEALLGPAEEVSASTDGGTRLVKAKYRRKGEVIDAVFAEGVLIRYSVSSE